jgi:hypothetical protein
VKEFTSGPLVLNVYTALAHVDGCHALILLDVPAPCLMLTLPCQALETQHVEAETLGAIIQWLGCYDNKQRLFSLRMVQFFPHRLCISSSLILHQSRGNIGSSM